MAPKTVSVGLLHMQHSSALSADTSVQTSGIRMRGLPAELQDVILSYCGNFTLKRIRLAGRGHWHDKAVGGLQCPRSNAQRGQSCVRINAIRPAFCSVIWISRTMSKSSSNLHLGHSSPSAGRSKPD